MPKSFEDQIFAACVRPGDVVYDVGANNGETAIYLARLAGPAGTVVSFEPVPTTYRLLSSKIQADGYQKAPILTMPFGLSESDGELDISMPEGRHGLASIGGAAEGLGRVVTHRCELRALDGVIATGRVAAPDFLKIDVEGAELLVLRGAPALLGSARPPLILCEVFAPWARKLGFTPADVIRLLGGYNYRFLFACPKGLVRHEPSADRPVPECYRDGYNIVAYQTELHRERVDQMFDLMIGSSGLLPMTPPPEPNV